MSLFTEHGAISNTFVRDQCKLGSRLSSSVIKKGLGIRSSKTWGKYGLLFTTHEYQLVQIRFMGLPKEILSSLCLISNCWTSIHLYFFERRQCRTTGTIFHNNTWETKPPRTNLKSCQYLPMRIFFCMKTTEILKISLRKWKSSHSRKLFTENSVKIQLFHQ